MNKKKFQELEFQLIISRNNLFWLMKMVASFFFHEKLHHLSQERIHIAVSQPQRYSLAGTLSKVLGKL